MKTTVQLKQLNISIRSVKLLSGLFSNARLSLLFCILLFGSFSQAQAVDIDQYPALAKLVGQMVKEDGFSRSELASVLADAKVDPKTIDLMNRQYEAQPWYKYRDIFINQARIDKGVEFIKEHKSLLDAANDKYGVPPHVITALIGVETHYGTRMGNRRVLDSLVTLTADFPK